MAVAPLRGLGSLGILADPDPFDLPPAAFSAGVNVRFSDGRVSRGPVQRKAGALSHAPRFMVVNPGAGGAYDDIYIGTQTGRVIRWAPSVGETDVSPSGFVDAPAEALWSGTRLAECLYVNRPDRVPWVLTKTASAFEPLPHWDAGWRANIVRSYSDALVALGMTKGGVSYPTMVKVSDIALAGEVPGSWDEGDPTKNTYENVITGMTTSIVDGLALRDSFVIYGQRETYLMQATGDSQVYGIRPLFRDAGAINANCVVELDSKHYVFGPTDIWVHDGVGKQSIADGRVRKFLYRSLNLKKASSCFVAHNAVLKELHFCFVSGDRLTHFGSDTRACNRSAVYHYPSGTWSFDDLPRVYSSCAANADTILTWANVTTTWDNTGGSWLDQEDGLKQGLMFAGEASAAEGLTDAVYVNDQYGEGSLFAFAVDTAANPSLQLERDGIDLDELNEELRGYKVVKALYPQGRVDRSGAPIEFAFGSSDGPEEDVEWSDWMTYDGRGLYKLDYRSAGRFLSMRIRYQDFKSMTLSGLDLDLKVLGRR